MQKLFSTYLFQHKKCAIPGVGTLEMRQSEAGVEGSENKITAPVSAVYFSANESSADDFEQYISTNKHLGIEDVRQFLRKTSEDINGLLPGEKFSLPAAGDFYRNVDGEVTFLAATLPGYYFSDVPALRVIHPDKAHAILVGDKETDSAVMTDYYAGDKAVSKERWWLWAALLFIIAASAVFAYSRSAERNALFGIAHKNDVKPAPRSYTKFP